MTSETAGLTIRPAGPPDLDRVLQLIRELAEYEREPDAVVATVADLTESFFGETPVASCLVAETGGQIVGIAVWFVNFSTWRGKPGIYLEDLYVSPDARGTGAGYGLISQLRRIATDRGYDRMDWSVLDWNVDAQAFYRRIGASPNEGWTTWRVPLHEPSTEPA